jgi:hypothetical protein
MAYKWENGKVVKVKSPQKMTPEIKEIFDNMKTFQMPKEFDENFEFIHTKDKSGNDCWIIQTN